MFQGKNRFDQFLWAAMKICKIIFLYLVIGWIYLMKSSQIEQIRSEIIIFILIFQTGKKSIFRQSFVRLNLIEYFEVIVFLRLTRQIDKEKVSLHCQCHFYENCI